MLVILGVLGFLVSILVFMASRRWGIRCALASAALVVVGSLFHLPTSSAPQPLDVRAAARGGWTVSVPEVAGATAYTVTVNGTTVGTFASAGSHEVPEPGWQTDSYGPAPVHTVSVSASGPGGVAQDFSATVCAPVVFLAARGTGENPGKKQYADGIGSRGWRTWHYLATKLGVGSPTSGQEPTVVLAAPVQYPADVIGTGVGYASSRNEGTAYLDTIWRSTLTECPDSAIVAFGYSQGADVVASVWQKQDLPTERALGVVLFADPHFNQKWAEQGITYPKGAVYKHNGLLGSRPMFDDSKLDPIQAWCWPADPVCQTSTWPKWHGDAYDCYEEWAAYNLAVTLAPGLRDKGYDVPPPVAPTCPQNTRGRGQH